MSGCSSVWFSGTNFGKGHFEKQLSEIILNLKTVVQEELSFKYIFFSNILVTLLFGRAEYLCNLSRVQKR